MDSPFLSGPPEVTLIDATDKPYDTAVAAARTCYSANGIVLPDQVSGTRKARTVRDRIASSTLTAGHLTTRQHATFIFGIDKVSRAAVWSFLHGHPFYNSEQVSQRYVEVQPGTYVVPKLEPHADAVYGATVQMQIEAYQLLIKLLGPTIRDEFHALFPARANRPDRWERFLERKAYEIARYVLPIATYTYLYHTVSALTLMRYARLASFFDAPTEQRALIDAMVAAVVAKDELFPRELNDPIPLEQTPEYAYLTGIDSTVQREHATEFAQEFDHRLGDRTSVLIGWDEHAERIMADAVRATLGAPESILSDKEALALLLDPSRNAYYTETMNVHTLTKISRAMNHVTYTFAKKLSHTADSQDQRHRMVPASRPVLSAVYSGASDTVTPKLIMMNDAAQEAFDDANAVAFENINRLLDAGVPDEYAFYLLPNAYSIRMVESGSLMGLHHKWRTRLCYTAQEEIWHATMDEVTQVSRIHPTVGKYMHAPCWFRMETPGTTPYCPEGDRFCGVPVWKLDVNAFQRVL